MNHKPNKSMQKAAAQALRWRDAAPESQKAGTRVGIYIANHILRRHNLSLYTIARIYLFLIRNERFKNYEAGTKARQAWGLWGGQAGLNWSGRILRKEGWI
ncbi:MAG: hypothetical protein EBS07_10425 [Sphingobacteriia bacterium]|nr:hypothetical protein [Sphingobacteriia bacterium]